MAFAHTLDLTAQRTKDEINYYIRNMALYDYNRFGFSLKSKFKKHLAHLRYYKNNCKRNVECAQEECSQPSDFAIAVWISPNNTVVTTCCKNHLEEAVLNFSPKRVFYYSI